MLALAFSLRRKRSSFCQSPFEGHHRSHSGALSCVKVSYVTVSLPVVEGQLTLGLGLGRSCQSLASGCFRT